MQYIIQLNSKIQENLTQKKKKTNPTKLQN